MPVSKRDREFRLPKISYVDFKHIEMDRVLTRLFERLQHDGYPSRVRRNFELLPGPQNRGIPVTNAPSRG